MGRMATWGTAVLFASCAGVLVVAMANPFSPKHPRLAETKVTQVSDSSPVVEEAAEQLIPMLKAGDPILVAMGDTIELDGSGFSENATIHVGYKFVYRPFLIKGGKARFSAPELLPGEYDIKITNPDGKTAVSRNRVEYLDSPTIELEETPIEEDEDGTTLRLSSVSDKDLHVAVVGRPAGFRISFPEGVELKAGGTLPVRVEPTQQNPPSAVLVLQAGGMRDSVKLTAWAAPDPTLVEESN